MCTSCDNGQRLSDVVLRMLLMCLYLQHLLYVLKYCLLYCA